MKKRNKTLIISIVLATLLIMILGITYASLNYTQTSTNQQLVLGDIWMKYTEFNGISLENSMPGDDYTNYFEFTIDGKNTYAKKDIWYDIKLVKGDVPEGKTEDNRVEDKYLKFKLVEVNGEEETEIFKDQTYNNLTNQRIHVETISKNINNYSKTYRLYMVISEKLVIGNVEGAISTEEFANLFGSIKVNVTGDFNEKEITYEDRYGVLEESCFNYNMEYNGNTYSKTMTSPFIVNDIANNSEKLAICTNYVALITSFSTGDAEYLCKGESIPNGFFAGMNLKSFLLSSYYTADYEYLLDEGIITMGGYGLNDLTNDSEKLAICTDYSVSLTGAEEGTTEYDEYYLIANSLCSGEKYEGMNLVELYAYYSSNGVSIDYEYLLENDILYFEELEGEIDFEYKYISSDNGNALNINNIDKSQATITLENYNDEKCGKDLVIPKQIQDIDVTVISFPDPLDFSPSLSLDTLVIPNSVTQIGASSFYASYVSEIIFEENSNLETISYSVFYGNNLETLIIPESVKKIYNNAFSTNKLKTVTIEGEIEEIGPSAFEAGYSGFTYSLNLIFKRNTCSQIINMSFFPWAKYETPHYYEGYKPIIIGTDGECSY